MKIHKLILKNIRSYNDDEIIFPEGVVLLAGDIGTGKTTILMAIEYALFGLQPGQKGSALLRHNAETGEVILDCEIAGKEVRIERRLRRSSKTISNEYASITIDGIKEESSITEIKTKILSLLGYPNEFIKRNNLLYKYTVYTPQEQMKQIILEDAESRLNVLRYVFGIDKYKIIRENLQVLIASLKEETKFMQGELKSLETDEERKKSLYDRIDILADTLSKKEFELQNKREKRKKIELEINEIEKRVEEKEQFEREYEKTSVLLTARKESIKSLQKQIMELEKAAQEASSQFDMQEYNNVLETIKKLTEKIEEGKILSANLTTSLKFIVQNKNDLNTKKGRIVQLQMCPTCLQTVSDNYKKNVLQHTEADMSSLLNQEQVDQKRLTEVSFLMKENQSELSILEKKKQLFERQQTLVEYAQKAKIKINGIEEEKSTIEKDITLLIEHQASLKEDIFLFSKYANQLKLKQGELKLALTEEKTVEIQCAEIRKERQLNVDETQLLEKQITEKHAKKKKLSYLLDLLGWLSNQFSSLLDIAESTIMFRVRSEFSRVFSAWFKSLVSDEAFQIRLDESFTPIIMQGENETDYAFLSGGERTAVALAYRLALNQTINELITGIQTKDLILLDEPTEGFSELQLEKLRDIIAQVKVKQLIIVSHEQKIEGFVDKVIRLRKEGLRTIVEPGPTIKLKY